MVGSLVTRKHSKMAGAATAQLQAIDDWLSDLPEIDFARARRDDRWTVRHLVGQLIEVVTSTTVALGHPTTKRPEPLIDHWRANQGHRDERFDQVVQVLGDDSGRSLARDLHQVSQQLIRQLEHDDIAEALEVGIGPIATTDRLRITLMQLTDTADELTLVCQHRTPIPIVAAADREATRTMADLLAKAHPGSSTEVRVPPYAAVQIGLGDGPRHTRGTPGSVVECGTDVFRRLCSGRLTWEQARSSGAVHASGAHSDLSTVLPLS